MLRSEWSFTFAASELVKAAGAKVAFHTERQAWWEEKKKAVMAEVKDSGIEVTESVAALGGSYTNTKASPQVMVRADLQSKLTECHQKIMEHVGKVREYNGWVQVLQANGEQKLELHADDYLFFYGK